MPDRYAERQRLIAEQEDPFGLRKDIPLAQQVPEDPYESYLVTPSNYDPSLPANPGQAEQAAADPRAIAAQQEALRYLQQVSTSGFTPEELASLQASRASQLAGERAAFDTDLHLAEQRGVTGIDVADAARAAAQGTGMRTALGDLDQQALARQRAMEATRAQFEMASQMRAGNFGEMERRAAAQQARERMTQDFSNQRAQDWANWQNRAAQQNAQAPQQYFTDQMARGASEMETLQGVDERQRAEQQRREEERHGLWRGILGTTGAVFGGAAGGPGGATAGQAAGNYLGNRT